MVAASAPSPFALAAPTNSLADRVDQLTTLAGKLVAKEEKGQKKNTNNKFGPHWACKECRCPDNFDSRTACRSCGASRHAVSVMGKGKGKGRGGVKGNIRAQGVKGAARASSLPPPAPVLRETEASQQVMEVDGGELELEEKVRFLKSTEAWHKQQPGAQHAAEAQRIRRELQEAQEQLKATKPPEKLLLSALSRQLQAKKNLEEAEEAEEQAVQQLKQAQEARVEAQGAAAKVAEEIQALQQRMQASQPVEMASMPALAVEVCQALSQGQAVTKEVKEQALSLLLATMEADGHESKAVKDSKKRRLEEGTAADLEAAEPASGSAAANPGGPATAPAAAASVATRSDGGRAAEGVL